VASITTKTRKDGGASYVVEWRDESGDKRRRTFRVSRDAERFAARIETAKAEGRPTLEHNPRGETVAQVVEMSLAAAAQKLKPGTLAGYRLMYDRAILPEFGRLRVTAVTSQRVEAWVAKLTAQGLAPHTVHNYWVGLSRLFTYAIRHRIHPGPNPCAAVERPKNRPREDFAARFLTAAQVEAVAGHLAEREEWMGTLFRFMSFTGLRASEVAGLRVQDVVLGGGAHVEVRQTYRRINNVWVKGTPKSSRSTRDVPILSRALVAELRKVLLANPNSGDPEALFWPARENGSRRLDWSRPIAMSGFLNYYLLPAAQAVGVDHIRNHDTRHTAASLWLAAGFQPFQVSRWLGHSSLELVGRVYGHLYVSDYSAEVERFEAFTRTAEA
jgi:integrase